MIVNIQNDRIKKNQEDFDLKRLELGFCISYKSVILDYLIEDVIPLSNKEIIKVNLKVKIEFDFRDKRDQRETRIASTKVFI